MLNPIDLSTIKTDDRWHGTSPRHDGEVYIFQFPTREELEGFVRAIMFVDDPDVRVLGADHDDNPNEPDPWFLDVLDMSEQESDEGE